MITEFLLKLFDFILVSIFNLKMLFPYNIIAYLFYPAIYKSFKITVITTWILLLLTKLINDAETYLQLLTISHQVYVVKQLCSEVTWSFAFLCEVMLPIWHTISFIYSNLLSVYRDFSFHFDLILLFEWVKRSTCLLGKL